MSADLPRAAEAPTRCAHIAPPSHDYPGLQCGLLSGHPGAHTVLTASEFLNGPPRAQAAPLRESRAGEDEIMRLVDSACAAAMRYGQDRHNQTGALTSYREYSDAYAAIRAALARLTARDAAPQAEWVPDEACAICKGSGIAAYATPYTPSEPCICLQPRASGPVPVLICGPTCGCGKPTPFVRLVGGWQTPEQCMHCKKGFGPSYFVASLAAPAARDAATPRTSDFREAVELLRIGCNDGWNHGELAMAEQIVARYDADAMPAGEYFAGLRERIEEKPDV